MGAWGPAIFSDDTACDIRGDYRELLEDGVDDREATQRVIDAYQHLGDDESYSKSNGRDTWIGRAPVWLVWSFPTFSPRGVRFAGRVGAFR